MVAEITAISENAVLLFAAANDDAAFESARAEFFGRRSRMAEIRKSMGSLPSASKPIVGRALSEANTRVQVAVDAAVDRLDAARESQMLDAERLDLTLPGRKSFRGHQHLLTKVMDDFCDVFIGMGYRIATGPQVESDWYNFEALNIPPTHPSRAETDTIYIDSRDGKGGDRLLLRTHTSPAQIRLMQTAAPPLYYVMPGRVFRQDTMDATHSNQFHQVEGLAIDRDITFGDMAGTIERFASEFFGPGFKIRLFPDYFPFTEPSAGMEVWWEDRWLEIAGLGMVDPNVLRAVGYDPDEWQGFAFGFGVERIAMLRYGVDDIRLFYDNDIRFLEQFQ